MRRGVQAVLLAAVLMGPAVALPVQEAQDIIEGRKIVPGFAMTWATPEQREHKRLDMQAARVTAERAKELSQQELRGELSLHTATREERERAKAKKEAAAEAKRREREAAEETERAAEEARQEAELRQRRLAPGIAIHRATPEQRARRQRAREAAEEMASREARKLVSGIEMHRATADQKESKRQAREAEAKAQAAAKQKLDDAVSAAKISREAAAAFQVTSDLAEGRAIEAEDEARQAEARLQDHKIVHSGVTWHRGTDEDKENARKMREAATQARKKAEEARKQAERAAEDAQKKKEEMERLGGGERPDKGNKKKKSFSSLLG